jgi:hypothetical protein
MRRDWFLVTKKTHASRWASAWRSLSLRSAASAVSSDVAPPDSLRIGIETGLVHQSSRAEVPKNQPLILWHDSSLPPASMKAQSALTSPAPH